MREQKTKPATLVIGIGNMGRNDDGLGWNFAEQIEQLNIPNIACAFRFQLQVEDAHLISLYERIFFADASHRSIDNGFEISECRPVNHFYFSSHNQSPETILYLAKELYQKDPVAYTVAIAGEDWNFENKLSKTAKLNLGKALKEFEKYYF